MTIRWKPGKEPTEAEVRAAITNALDRFLDNRDVERIAKAVHKLYRDRIEGHR